MATKNPSKAGQKAEKIISNSVDDFNEGVGKTQNNIYRRLVSLLGGLSLNRSGDIERTSGNLRLIRQINSEINNEIFNQAYTTRLSKFLGAFTKIENELLGYYEKVFGYESAPIHGTIKKDAIRTVSNQLGRAGINSAFTEPLKRILDTNVTTGANISDLTDQVRNYILGGQNDGALLRYTKQVTSDALHVYSGVYNKIASEDLGLKWLKYTGSVKDTTRDFCQRRAGKFFRESEVKSWAALSWKGKAAGTTETSIFYFVGGYNCRHILIYVDESVVPDSLKN